MNSAFFLFAYSTTIQSRDYQNISQVPKYKRAPWCTDGQRVECSFFLSVCTWYSSCD